jgi:hypothetical protein
MAVRFPRRDEIEPWLQGEDGANCLLIAVGWSIELSHLIVVGVNLAGALCTTDTLAGVLLSSVPQVVSSRRGLMMEGVAMLRRMDIRYRTVLLPVSEVGLQSTMCWARRSIGRCASTRRARHRSISVGYRCPASPETVNRSRLILPRQLRQAGCHTWCAALLQLRDDLVRPDMPAAGSG